MHLQDRDFALVIGINDYPNYGAAGNNLQGAADDAREVAAWLTNRDDGGGLLEAHCELVVSTVSPLRPRKTEIDDALERLYHASEKVADPRRFYLYFSGHGHAEQIDDVSLCMANWSFIRRQAALSSADYRRYLHHCFRVNEVVVILDCCRLREVAASGFDTELRCPLPDRESGGSRRFIAYATEFQQAAFEDQGSDRVRGHLTSALLEALRGAAGVQPGGGVAAEDLNAYLEKRVPALADDHGQHQQVQVVSDLPADPPTIFGAKLPQAAAANCRIRFSAERRGPIRLEGPSLEILREGPVDSAPWDLRLEIGHHCLIDVATGVEHNFRQRTIDGVADVRF